MADGDAASAIGLAIMTGLEKVRLVWQQVNKTRDMLANHIVSGTHSAAQITSGVLAIARGGTGGGTAAAARGALGLGTPTPTSGAVANALVMRDGAGNIAINNGSAPQSPVAYNQVDNLAQGNMNPAVYSNPIFGTRNALWVETTGRIGYAASSKFLKQDFELPDITVEQLRAIRWTLYRYRREVAREKRERGYRASTEIGLLAEDLHEAGLWPFVIYIKRKPAGIHYELLGMAALELAQRAFDAIDDLTRRVTDLEGGH